MRYFDTGVLLKLYFPEPRAAEPVTFANLLIILITEGLNIGGK
jgi:hypothetical protein